MILQVCFLWILLFTVAMTVFAQTEATIFKKFESKFYAIDGCKINMKIIEKFYQSLTDVTNA